MKLTIFFHSCSWSHLHFFFLPFPFWPSPLSSPHCLYPACMFLSTAAFSIDHSEKDGEWYIYPQFLAHGNPKNARQNAQKGIKTSNQVYTTLILYRDEWTIARFPLPSWMWGSRSHGKNYSKCMGYCSTFNAGNYAIIHRILTKKYFKRYWHGNYIIKIERIG